MTLINSSEQKVVLTLGQEEIVTGKKEGGGPIGGPGRPSRSEKG